MQRQAEMVTQTIRYRIKKDTWIVVLMGVVLIFPLLLLILLLFSRPLPLAGIIILLIASTVIWGTFFAGLYPAFYELTLTALIIHSGLLHKEISLSSIQRIQSPSIQPHITWSFDQLQIDYKKEKLAYPVHAYISPENKESFLEEIHQRIKENKGE